jgi:hypothetical protein
MPAIVVNHTPATTQMLRQYLSRPAGFGFLETFCPLPEREQPQQIYKERLKFWGVQSDDVGSHRLLRVEPPASVPIPLPFGSSRFVEYVLDMFPGARSCVHATYDDYYASEYPVPVTEEWTKRKALWAKTAASKRTKLPEIFNPRRFRCVHCDTKFPEHVNGQCLFGPTKFTPEHTEWKTLVGDYVWQPSSGSFVKRVGSTTTTTTTVVKG